MKSLSYVVVRQWRPALTFLSFGRFSRLPAYNALDNPPVWPATICAAREKLELYTYFSGHTDDGWCSHLANASEMQPASSIFNHLRWPYGHAVQ